MSLKASQAKTIEKVEQMLFDLKIKTEQNTSTSTARTILRKEKEIVFDESIDSDSSSSASDKIYLLENLIPCLLQKTGIQNSFLLICSLKKEFFKPSFLFLLISFMNEILMVYLNMKLLIK